MALCLVAVLGIALTSYLSLCNRTLDVSYRAFQNQQSGQLAERGLEEALWAINNNDWTTSGWLLNGSTATLTISPLSLSGIASGTIKARVENYSSSAPVAYAEGTATLPNGDAIRTQLRANLAPVALFPNAIAATSTSSTRAIRFRNKGAVDSYDSRLGPYNTSSNRGSAAVLSAPTVTLTAAQVYGYVATTGATPSYTAGSAAIYGPSTPGGTLVDPSRISTSAYQPLIGVKAVTGGSLMPYIGLGTTIFGTAGDTTPTVYVTSDIYIGSGQILQIDGPVVLDLTGTLTVTGTGKIVITTNGSLEIHLAGSLYLGGGGIDNQTHAPQKLTIFGSDTGNDTPSISSATALYGCIYMPNDGLTITSPTTTTPFNFYGAMVVNTVYFNVSSTTNYPLIHYDVSLRDVTFTATDTAYGISEFRELVTASSRTTF